MVKLEHHWDVLGCAWASSFQRINLVVEKHLSQTKRLCSRGSASFTEVVFCNKKLRQHDAMASLKLILLCISLYCLKMFEGFYFDALSRTRFKPGSAFAALRHDGTLVTWGDPTAGGESTGVQDLLSKVL